MADSIITAIQKALNFDKSICVLPHYGEFGWLVQRHMRLVSLIKTPYLVVCCRHGEEVFYPNADEFYYGWEDSVPDTAKKGYWDNYAVEEKNRLIEDISLPLKYKLFKYNLLLIALRSTLNNSLFDRSRICRFSLFPKGVRLI